MLDNGGGGIFSFLPQRAVVEPETFSQLFTTRRSPSLGAVSAAFGIPVETVGDTVSLLAALQRSPGGVGMRIIVCDLPDHDANVALNAELVAAGLTAAASVDLG